MTLKPQKILDHMVNVLPRNLNAEEGTNTRILLGVMAEGIAFAIQEQEREIRKYIARSAT